MEILRSDMAVFCLNEAIDLAFNKPSTVEKDGLIGLPLGTVVVNGVSWDWIKTHDRYRFILAK